MSNADAQINRVPAAPIENIIVAAVRDRLKLSADGVGLKRSDPIADVDLIATYIASPRQDQNFCGRRRADFR